MIDFKQTSKFYNNKSGQSTALDRVNLSIPQGCIFGVIGQSGAGKSTLLRCINALTQPDSGEVHINGQNLTTCSARELTAIRRQIGMIFQHFNLLRSQTVYDNILLPLKIVNTPSPEAKARIIELAQELDIEALLDRYPDQLSGGQKQRAAIARALAYEPKILLCDEATSALDPKATATILSLLKRLNQERNITIVLITHEMSVVKAICDQAALMEDGKVIETGSVLSIFSEPQTNLAHTLVADRALPEMIAKRLSDEQAPNTVGLYSLQYLGSQTSQPLLSTVIQQFGLSVNILQGEIEAIQGQTLGRMVVTIDGPRLEEGIAYLQKAGIRIESLGYVRRDP